MSRRIQDDSEGEAAIASPLSKRNAVRRASSKSIIDSSDEESGLFEDKELPLSEITGGAPNSRTPNARTTPSRRTSLQAGSMSAEKTPSSLNRRRTTARSSPMDDSDDLDPDPRFSIRSGKRARTATSLNFDNIEITAGDTSAALADAPIVDDAFNDALSVSVSAASRRAFDDFDIFSEPSTVIPDDLMAMTSKTGKGSSSSMSALPVPKPSIFAAAHSTDTLPASPSRYTTGADPVHAQAIVRPATTSLESQTPCTKAMRAPAQREGEGTKEETLDREDSDDVDVMAVSAVLRRRSAPGVKKEVNRGAGVGVGVGASVIVDLDDDVDAYDLASSTPPATAPVPSAFASRNAPVGGRVDATDASTIPSTVPNATATPGGSGPVRKLDLRAYCTGKRGKTVEDAVKAEAATEAVKADSALGATGASEGAAVSTTAATPVKEESVASTMTKPITGSHATGNTVAEDIKNEKSATTTNPADLTFKTPIVRRSSSLLRFAVPQPKAQDSLFTPSPQQAVSRAAGKLASAAPIGAIAAGHAAPFPSPASPASSAAEMTAEMMATPLAARLKARAQGYNVSLETIDALTPAREAADARTRSVSRPSRPKPLVMHPRTPSGISAAPANAMPTPTASTSSSVLATCPRYPGTLPLLLPKLHAPKAVVFEFADAAVDLNGESGVVGRLQGTAQGGLRVDMQGILFDALFVPSASHMVVSVGEEDVQVEAIVDNVARLYKLGDMQDWEEIEGLDLFSMEDADVDVNKDWKASGGGDGAEGGKGKKGKGGKDRDGEASARGQSKGVKEKSASTKDKRSGGAGGAVVKGEREKSNSGKTKEAKPKTTEKEKKSVSATKSSSKSGTKDATEKGKDKAPGAAAGKRKASAKAAAADGDSSESDWAPRQSKAKRK